MVIKTIGILYHPLNEATYTLAKQLKEFLTAKGCLVWLCSAWEGETARTQVSDTDLMLSIGGDGTILRTAQAVVPGKTPITGINLGKLGFMTELSVAEVMAKLPPLLAGEGWIDERFLLEAELTAASDERGVSPVFYALNDVVVARGAVPRVIYVDASVNDELLTTYKSDGVIVATATGSTGYALAVGGPILYPQAKEFLLLPISSHLGLTYPMVLSPETVLRLRVTAIHPAALSIDGHINLPLSSGDTIIVKRSPNTVRFLRIRSKASFYSSLEQRLKGK